MAAVSVRASPRSGSGLPGTRRFRPAVAERPPPGRRPLAAARGRALGASPRRRAGLRCCRFRPAACAASAALRQASGRGAAAPSRPPGRLAASPAARAQRAWPGLRSGGAARGRRPGLRGRARGQAAGRLHGARPPSGARGLVLATVSGPPRGAAGQAAVQGARGAHVRRRVRALSARGRGTAGACQRRPASGGAPQPRPGALRRSRRDPARLRGARERRRAPLATLSRDFIVNFVPAPPCPVEPPAAPRVCKQAAGWCQRQVVVAVVLKFSRSCAERVAVSGVEGGGGGGVAGKEAREDCREQGGSFRVGVQVCRRALLAADPGPLRGAGRPAAAVIHSLLTCGAGEPVRDGPGR